MYNIKERFRILFSIKESYSLQELEPYLLGLYGNNTGKPAISSHARSQSQATTITTGSNHQPLPLTKQELLSLHTRCQVHQVTLHSNDNNNNHELKLYYAK